MKEGNKEAMKLVLLAVKKADALEQKFQKKFAELEAAKEEELAELISKTRALESELKKKNGKGGKKVQANRSQKATNRKAPCKFLRRNGACTQGDKCKFRHEGVRVREGAEVQRCHNCGEEGHLLAVCQQKVTLTCHNCQQVGHLAAKCDKPRKKKRAEEANSAPTGKIVGSYTMEWTQPTGIKSSRTLTRAHPVK